MLMSETAEPLRKENMSADSINPERYYKWFEGILPAMIDGMTGGNPHQSPDSMLEVACHNQLNVLRTYQKNLAELEGRADCNYPAYKVMVEDFASLVEVLCKLKDRLVQAPLNPVLCAIVMSAGFAQSRVIREKFNKTR